MNSNSLSGVHYAGAATLLTIYGGAVCPLIESLDRVVWATTVVCTFTLGWLLRTVALSTVQTRRGAPPSPAQSLFTDLSVLALVAVAIATVNSVQAGFMLESVLKVLVGVSAVGYFIATDTLLCNELQTGRDHVERGENHHLDSARRSFSRRFLIITLISLTIVAVVLVLLVNKQLLVMSWTETAPTNSLRLGIVIESIFVVAVVAAYVCRTMHSASKLLAFYLRNQQHALEMVSAGNYEHAVPVVSNDEFGDIARHTNRMIDTIIERSAELQRTQNATILALAALAETRDNETGAHITRTQHYVKALADHLSAQPEYRDQLTPEVVDLIYKSTPLHDIGKVGIPDNVLLKPGKLTDDEYQIMKTHTELGLNALEVVEAELGSSNFLCYAKDVVATHHERWDGKGYPAGLAGEDIPLCGRLMAVADVYDALISERVYKPAFDHDTARDIIVEGRGTQFDPAVVDAFLACEASFANIAKRLTQAAKVTERAA
ncbi:MAG: HD domain-containing phosphohydrolase [Pseudomonadota bacterium]